MNEAWTGRRHGPAPERMLDFLRQLCRARDLDELIDIVRLEARESIGAAGASLILAADAFSGHPGKDAPRSMATARHSPAERHVGDWVIRHGEPAAIADVHADHRTPADADRPAFLKSMLMVPVRPSAPIGALGTHWAKEHAPTDDEIRLLQALADDAAAALEQFRRQSALEARVKEQTEALAREIAERTRVEATLRESVQRFASIVESAMDAIISIDERQRIVFINAAAADMFRYPAEESIGKPIELLIPERFRATHAEHVRQFLASGTTSRRMGKLQQLRGLRADGEEFPLEASISKAELASGVVATVIVRDISTRVAAETALAASEARLRYVTQAAEIGYWDWDIATGRLEWSARCRAIFGMRDDEPLSYARFLAAVHPDDRLRADATVRSALAGGGDYNIEYRTRWPDGTVRWVHAKGRVTFDTDGRAQRMGGIAIDITARKLMEVALRESETRFRTMADTAPAMLWVTEHDGNCSFISRGWYDYTGQAPGSGRGFGWLKAVHPEDRAMVKTRLEGSEGGYVPFEHEVRVRHADGGYRWALNAGRPRLAEDGGFLGYIGSVIDITERKRAEEMVRQHSLHDPLTGLPNRALTREFCEHLLAGSKRRGARSAVMFVDLDRFKPINDTHGHHIGDAVLREVARRLRTCVRREDVVGRLGGDEFLIALSHIHAVDEAAQAATHILATLSEPYEIGQLGKSDALRLETTPSIGISLFPDDGEDIDTLTERADAAMYRAKAAGRANFRFFS